MSLDGNSSPSFILSSTEPLSTLTFAAFSRPLSTLVTSNDHLPSTPSRMPAVSSTGAVCPLCLPPTPSSTSTACPQRPPLPAAHPPSTPSDLCCCVCLSLYLLHLLPVPSAHAFSHLPPVTSTAQNYLPSTPSDFIGTICLWHLLPMSSARSHPLVPHAVHSSSPSNLCCP